MKKITILTNIISPYRRPLFDKICSDFESYILLSGEEDNRVAWNTTDESGVSAKVIELDGFTLKHEIGHNSNVYNYRFIHVNPDILYKLWHINPNVVITFEMGPRTILSLIYCLMSGASLWVWWGGTKYTERNIGIIRQAVRWFLARVVPNWISYGDSSTEYLHNIGVSRDDILQAQNCVDERRFLSTNTSGVLDVAVRPALLFVGQLIDRKGIIPLLKAVSKVQSEGLNFSLYFVGHGPERDRYERIADKLSIQNVFFVGEVKPEKIPYYYNDADCLVFPTLEDVWGLVVNEAMWSGLPVLSSVYAGCTEELVPESNRIDPRDRTSLTSGIRRAVKGKLEPPDIERLLRHEEVAELITNRLSADE